MLDKVISGGQTGADQAALRAARAFGVPTGGFAPRGWLTEGPVDPETGEPFPREVCARELLEGFGLVECQEPGFPARTRANVTASDATTWLGDWHTPGGRTTLDACRDDWHKPWRIVFNGTRPSDLAGWLAEKQVRVLNVAGNRESRERGIGQRVERFRRDVFRRLGHAEGGCRPHSSIGPENRNKQDLGEVEGGHDHDAASPV
jgi:hypothetical protein